MRRERRDPTKMALIRSLPAFSSATTADLAVLAAALDIVDVPAGTVLFTEGRLGHDVMVVVEGEAAVTRAGRLAGRAGPGELVGEQAALEGGARSATVVATTAMRLLVAAPTSADALLRMVRTVPALAEAAARHRVDDAPAAALAPT